MRALSTAYIKRGHTLWVCGIVPAAAVAKEVKEVRNTAPVYKAPQV